jgi:putative transposase
MPLWRLYYHFVWSTHDRQPLITPIREAPLYQYIHDKSNSLGCYLHGIGGIDDHIHLIVSIPPKLALVEFVRLIKGSSSHYLNTSHPDPFFKFKWQQEYGVFSVSKRNLDQAIAYVQHQKHHHSNGTAIRALEPDSIPLPDAPESF